MIAEPGVVRVSSGERVLTEITLPDSLYATMLECPR
jgi:hypothetical protein